MPINLEPKVAQESIRLIRVSQLSKCFTVGLFTLALAAGQASASIIVFTGQDTGVGPGGAHPNSTAAAASFDTAAAALGIKSVITFEGATLGSFTSLNVAAGVSISGTNASGGNPSVLNVPNFPSAPSLDGFNTTPVGSEYMEVAGGTLTFTFATPTQFFGAYFTGVQTFFFNDVIGFSDGTAETVSVPGVGTSSSVGALDFVGFTDSGKSISSITINAGSLNAGFDDIGLDDVRFQSAPANAPEPGSIALMLIGGSGIFLGYSRRNASRSHRG